MASEHDIYPVCYTDEPNESNVTESTPFLNSTDITSPDFSTPLSISTGSDSARNTAAEYTISCLNYYDPYHDSTYAAHYLIPLKSLGDVPVVGEPTESLSPAVTPGAIQTVQRQGNGYSHSPRGSIQPTGTRTQPPLYQRPNDHSKSTKQQASDITPPLKGPKVSNTPRIKVESGGCKSQLCSLQGHVKAQDNTNGSNSKERQRRQDIDEASFNYKGYRDQKYYEKDASHGYNKLDPVGSCRDSYNNGVCKGRTNAKELSYDLDNAQNNITTHDITPPLTHEALAGQADDPANQDLIGYRIEPSGRAPKDPLAEIIEKQLTPVWKVDYIDFTPDICGFSEELICRENFQCLVKKANLWLKQNPQVELKTCETLSWSTHDRLNVGDSESVVQSSADEKQQHAETFHIMGLRLWLLPRQRPGPAQLLAYRDYKAYEGERLSQLTQKVNASLDESPIPGHIISFETVMAPNVQSWDTSCVFWQETRCPGTLFDLFLRLYYVEGSTIHHRLGIRNIVPEVVHGNHEPFSCLMRRASQWVSTETGVCVTNLRSTYVSRDNDTPSRSADRCTHFFRQFNSHQYFQILRVFYLCCPNQTSVIGRKNHVINCMTFTPVQTTLGVNVNASFEKMKSTMIRIGAWIRLSGAKIFSLESVITPLIPTMPNHTLPEISYWTQPMAAAMENTTRKYLVHIRIYIDGEFIDPDPRLLPPLPYSLTRELQNSIEEKEIKRFYKKKKLRKTQNRIAIAIFLFILLTVAIVIIMERLLKKYL